MKQKIIVVDENDVPIGLKYRDEIDYKKDIYRWSAIWIENSKKEVLIAQRKLTRDKDPGKWGPAVTGTIEEGETYESNAYKEIEEDLGVKVQSLQIGPKQRANEPRRYFGQWFLCVIDKPAKEFILQEDEVEQVVWIDKKELAKDIELYPEKYTSALIGIVGILL